jgi:hypothetical protein
MSKEWMIDVLNDLRSFAGANNMPGLSEALDDAMIVASAELRVEGNSADVRSAGKLTTGSVHRTHQENGYA